MPVSGALLVPFQFGCPCCWLLKSSDAPALPVACWARSFCGVDLSMELWLSNWIFDFLILGPWNSEALLYGWIEQRYHNPRYSFSLSAPSICERVTPRLSHANSAVVLSAVKVLMKFLELLPKDSDYYNMLLKKLAPPLVTLLSGEPEVQYVALRNINLIVQKRWGNSDLVILKCLWSWIKLNINAP